jgi:4-diphosphocytidyl-2-C-methyl-D-erythritol kinase
MIRFANCKINLGLQVTKKRADGFHNIETVFYPIPFYDIVEVISSPNNQFNFTSSGIKIPEADDNNLCIKAYKALLNQYPPIANVHLHLHKTIPLGAGLGGGSADAANVLLLLNEKFSLNLSDDTLKTIALNLGSDVPFFIENKASFATGRGEILSPVSVNLSSYKIVIINPCVHISTAWAFSNIIPKKTDNSIKKIIQEPIRNWKEYLLNDFEEAVFLKFPVVKEIKEMLYSQGAVYASMSGTGSTVYGIFEKEISLNIENSLFVKWL